MVATFTTLQAQLTRSSVMSPKQHEISMTGIKGNFIPASRAYGCGPDAFISSIPNPSGTAHVSCTESNNLIYQSFSGVPADITKISFWGLQLFHNGTGWQTCVSDPMPLTITFYQDSAGIPGPVDYTENVNLVPVNTGDLFANFAVSEFSYVPTTPVSLNAGWFSIQASGTGCWILLMDTENPLAHGTGMHSDSVLSVLDYPIGFCLEVDAGSCPFPLPNSLAVSNQTMTTADLSWVEAGVATQWDIEIGAKGFVPTGVPTYAGVTSNPYQLTGLTLGTAYDVYVRAFCDPDASFWMGPLTFYTPNCDPLDRCVYKFQMLDSYGDGWWGSSIEIIENGIQIASISLPNGTSVTEGVALCDGATIELSWTTGVYEEECGLNVLNSNQVAIYSFTAGNAPAAGVFHTFTVSCPSCPMPTALNAQNITLVSADLAWTPGGSEASWNIEWGHFGYTPGTGMLVSATTDNPYPLTGLTPSTYYSFYVQAICDAENSVIAGPFKFATDCPPFTTTLWTEGFEDNVFPPLCWRSYDQDGDGNFWDLSINPSGSPTHSGNGVALSESWSINEDALNPDNWLITPQFSIDADDFVFSLWYAAQDPLFPQEKFSILVSKLSSDPSDFIEVFTTVISSDDFTEVVIPLAAYENEDIYLAIRHWDCTDQFYMKIDDVSITSSSGLDISVLPSMNVYPNPSTDIVYISEKANVEIYTVQGQLVGSYENTYKIDVTGIEAGLYIFKVFTEGKVHSAKVHIVR